MQTPLSLTDRSPELLTPREVAWLLRVTPRTVRRYGASGRLERVRISRKTVRYSASSVAALLAPDASDAVHDDDPAGGGVADEERDDAAPRGG